MARDIRNENLVENNFKLEFQEMYSYLSNLTDVFAEAGIKNLFTEKQLRTARNAGVNPLRSVLSVVSVALVFALLAFYIYGQVQLTELTENINSAKTELAQLESVEVQLQMKAMADIDVSEIESYARNELQMELVNQNQITYISLNNRDVGEVIGNDNSNIFANIWSFLTSWAE